MKIFSKKSEKSFTLIELLVVIAIIGILSGIILVAVGGAREKANKVKAKMESKQIYNAVAMLENDTNRWPDNQDPYVAGQKNNNEICSDGCACALSEDCAGLTGEDGNYTNWQGPYMKEIPLDPWGNEYFFDTDYDIDPGPDREWVAVIGSYGPDGMKNNGYDSPEGYADDDIIYIIAREK